ncbi:MAG: ATPase domain-containing protein [Promethearchaeota archaeon]
MEFSLNNNELNNLITDDEEKKGLIMIWGDIGTGKTTLCILGLLSKLAQNKKVVFIDTKPYSFKSRFNELKRIYEAERNISLNTYDIILYKPNSFNKALKVILNLEFLILNSIKVFGENKIALIVIDSLDILMHLSMKKDATNEKLSQNFTIIMATLKYLNQKYGTSIIITGRSVIKTDKDGTIREYPANEKLSEYFISFRLKLSRLNDLNKDKSNYRKLQLEKHINNKGRALTLKLTNLGFI